MRIRAQLHLMAESDILAMVGNDKLAQIKMTDKSPMLRAYVIGHEGEARGRMIGVGNIVKKWFADAVEKLTDKIKIGLQLFHGHAATNDTAGRIPIGEVVGRRLVKIKDRLSSVVACWIYPDYRHLPLDVASIEADIDLRGDNKDSLYVADVNEISGIALGNSEVETPGFPGATLLGQLQAFAEKNDIKITLFEGGDMTLAELRKAVQEGKLKPTDIFEPEAIFADSLVSEQVKEKISNARGYDIRKFDDLTQEKASLAQKLKEVETKLGEKDGEIKTLRVEAAKSKVGSLFDSQKTERKLDEKQVKFIQNNLGKFAPENPDAIDKEFGSWLDAQVDEYTKIAEVLGIEVKAGGDNGGDKGDGGTGPAKDKSGGSPDSKYLDPAQNPMIKVDAD